MNKTNVHNWVSYRTGWRGSQYRLSKVQQPPVSKSTSNILYFFKHFKMRSMFSNQDKVVEELSSYCPVKFRYFFINNNIVVAEQPPCYTPIREPSRKVSQALTRPHYALSVVSEIQMCQRASDQTLTLLVWFQSKIKCLWYKRTSLFRNVHIPLDVP